MSLYSQTHINFCSRIWNYGQFMRGIDSVMNSSNGFKDDDDDHEKFHLDMDLHVFTNNNNIL